MNRKEMWKLATKKPPSQMTPRQLERMQRAFRILLNQTEPKAPPLSKTKLVMALLLSKSVDINHVPAMMDIANWAPISEAPQDGSLFYAYSEDLTGSGLAPFISPCGWHPKAGFCTDEIRTPTYYLWFFKPTF